MDDSHMRRLGGPDHQGNASLNQEAAPSERPPSERLQIRNAEEHVEKGSPPAPVAGMKAGEVTKENGTASPQTPKTELSYGQETHSRACTG